MVMSFYIQHQQYKEQMPTVTRDSTSMTNVGTNLTEGVDKVLSYHTGNNEEPVRLRQQEVHVGTVL